MLGSLRKIFKKKSVDNLKTDELPHVGLINKTFRVFVSSTLDDFKIERDALQKEVFPKLEKLCEDEGFSFQAIDLRWGVNTIAQYNQKTMKICLDEIKRCQETTPKPNFIVLLGNRYGWNPLPYEIKKEEFEEIHKLSTDSDKDILREWYECDYNSLPPKYILQPRTGIYTDITNPKVYKDLTEIENLISLIKKEKKTKNDKLIENLKLLKEFVKDEKNRELNIFKDSEIIEASEKLKKFFKNEMNPGKYIETRIRAIFQDNIKKIDEISDKEVQKYFSSATEQEIVYGALEVKDAKDHVFGFFRKINTDNLKENLQKYKKYPKYWENMKIFFNCDEDGNFNEEDLKSMEYLKNELEEKIPGNIHCYKPEIHKEYDPNRESNDLINNEFLKDFCDDVYNSLSYIISEQIKDFKDDPLKKEIQIHDNFANEKSKHFLGRKEIIEIIENYIDSDNDRPLAIVGESGLGKTALLAHISQKLKTNKKRIIISRYIGATPESSNITSLIKSIAEEIVTKYNQDKQMIPDDYQKLLEQFQNILGLAIDNEQLVIFIDAINQLSEVKNPQELAWLPQYLPKNVKIIISTISDDLGKNKTIKAINNIMPDENIKTLDKMDPDDGKKLLNSWLEEVDRTLTEYQENEILEKFNISKNPLFLKFAFEEALNWKSYTKNFELPATITDLVNHSLKRLSKDENHGKALTIQALCYLASARYGLSENELIEILSHDKEVIVDYEKRKSIHSPNVCKLPYITWSRLYFDLKPYLVTKDNDGLLLVNFYHQQITKTIEDKYLKDNKEVFHESLAKYFEEKSLSNHVLEELPWQLLQSKKCEELAIKISDMKFFIALFGNNNRNYQYDLLYYWSQIENRTQHTIKESYSKITDHLSEFDIYDLHRLAAFLQYTGNFEESNQIHKHAIQTRAGQNNKEGSQVSLAGQALILKNQGRLKEAMKLFKEQEKICRELNIKDGLQFSLGGQASILKMWGRLKEAMKLFKEQEKICRELNIKKDIANSLGGQALILKRWGRLKEAMKLHKEEEKICRKLQYKDGLQNSLGNQALIYMQGHLKESMKLLKEKEKICREIHNKEGIGVSLGNQAIILANWGRLDEAMELYKKEEKICRELNDKEGLTISLRNQEAILKFWSRR